MRKLVLLLLFFFIFQSSSQVITDYFYLGDASTVTTNSEDGRSQFFDYTPLMEIPFNITHAPFHPWDDYLKYLLVNYSLSVPGSQLQVQAAKIYSKYAGSLPKKLVMDEMAKSNADQWYTSGPEATAIFFKYIIGGDTVPIDQQPTQIAHEVLEVCVKVQTGSVLRDFFSSDYRHFLVDRGSHGGLPDIWSTRIRLVYTGKSNNCNLDDKAWADKRSGTYNASGVIKPQMNVIDATKVSNYNLGDVLDNCYSYFDHFPLYNTLYNCQHFATNLYNHITNKKTNFYNADIMIMKYANGTSNINKLLFDFPLVK